VAARSITRANPTACSASWSPRSPHASESVQHTLYNIADVVLASYQEISEISLALHERPYRPADLFTAGIENPDELFVAVDEPLGIVEVTVERE
jgi:urate oxidase